MDPEIPTGLGTPEEETRAGSVNRPLARPLPSHVGPYRATTVGNLALVEHELHNEVEAERLFREAIAIQRKTVGENSLGVAISTSGLAKALQGQKRYAEAEPLLLAAERLLIASSGENHRRVAKTRRRLARLYGETGRPELAVRYGT